MVKILIVDDEYLVRHGLRETIPWAELGIQIVGEAENGKKGWEAALQYQPDIILTDIKMPVMDGIEMMRMIRDSGMKPSFIVLSGYGEFDYAKGALRYGAVEYILKPVENEDLLTTIIQVREQISREQIISRIGKEKLIDDLLVLLKAIRTKKTRLSSQIVADALAYIHEHYAEDIAIEDLARHLMISPFYLMRLFKGNMNTTLIDYLIEYRIEQAKSLLKERKYKIYEVGHKVGYSDSRYFGKLFKRATGLTPLEYMKNVFYE